MHSIPTRRELVKEAARNPNSSELKATQHEAQTHAWSFCPLSSRPLVDPVVSDCAGILYNKDAILEYLLPNDDNAGREEKDEVLKGRVKSLKDVVEVKFQTEGKNWVCPVTGKELGAKTRSVYLVPCGHALSEVAVKEVGESSCSVCGETIEPGDIVPVLSMKDTDKEILRERAERLKVEGRSHSGKKVKKDKKDKKAAKKEREEEVARILKDDSLGDAEKLKLIAEVNERRKEKDEKKPEDSTKKRKAISELDQAPQLVKAVEVLPSSRSGTSTPVDGGIKNAATASLTAKVLAEQEEKNKRRRLGLNNNLKSLFSNKSTEPSKNNSGDFMTRGYSVPTRK